MTIEIQGAAGRAPVDVKESTTSAANLAHSGNKESAATLPASSSADRFSLTDQAAVLKSLEQQVANLPAVDSQRVTDVQHAIATGSLRINPETVADKMLRFEAGMPS